MKNIIIILVLIISVSCSKDDEPANLTIEVSFFYNNFQGYKPDVEAKAYLFDHSKTSGIEMDSMHIIDARIGKLVDKTGEWMDVEPIYEGEAGASGMISIDNIIPGYYLLILASKGRYSFTHKHQHIESGERLNLVKNFGYLYEFQRGGESW